MRKVTDLMLEIREFVALQFGKFTLQELYNALEVTSRIDKKNISTYMIRLIEEGIIERDPIKSGTFRIIVHDIDEIDFKNAPKTIFPIVWPLKIDKLVSLYPKTIAVIAGEPESGKTAFILNLIYLNNVKHANDIVYFSSEMGAVELRNRLDMFDKEIDWWKFMAYERSDNFADVIEPDAINLIDYLEISDSFFKVAGQIKEIRDKLNRGVAIIAIQKSEGTKYGRGGSFGAEKARIYLSLEAITPSISQIIIRKAKNRASSINPNGLMRTFSISGGAIITPLINEWVREDEK